MIHAFDGIESVEMHNNVFFRRGGGAVTLMRDEGAWTTGKVFAGSKNFVPTGTAVPSGWSGTLVGADPGFTNVDAKDVRPRSGSVLINTGATSPASPVGHAFPSPLASPLWSPPLARIHTSAVARTLVGTVDIGAYEYGSSSTTTPSPTACASAAAAQWKNTPFAAKTGTFSATFDVTPSRADVDVDVDGAVGFSMGAASTWPGLAAIVRFNVSGKIDVRNGSTYGASTMAYAAGTKYRVRVAVNVTSHTYSVYVAPAGGAETALASNVAFRTEWASVASLDNWVATTTAGTLAVCPVSGP